jgi:hypothetical protein
MMIKKGCFSLSPGRPLESYGSPSDFHFMIRSPSLFLLTDSIENPDALLLEKHFYILLYTLFVQTESKG